MALPLKPILFGAAALVAATAFGLNLSSQSTAQNENTLDKEEMRVLVREILMEDPQIIIDALNAYRDRMDAEEAEAALKNVQSHRAALLKADHGFAYGANDEERQVVVVELFDYHCGFCKKATDFVRTLPDDDSGVQVILRELPLLNEQSDVAASYALAAREQGKYFDYHFALMKTTGLLTDERIEAIATDKGLDLGRLKNDRKAASITEALSETLDIARDINVSGTPSFIVLSPEGDYTKVIGGYDPDAVLAAIREAKAKG